MVESERFIQILEESLKCQKQILALLEARAPIQNDDLNKWIGPEKVLEILSISTRTLYRLRKNNEITWTKKGSRYYYFAPDVFNQRDHFLK